MTEKDPANRTSSTTLICCKCRKPLWEIELKGQYGTRFNATKTPYTGVPEFSEYWTKNGQPIRTDCPFCGEDYMRAVRGPRGTLIAVPSTLDPVWKS